MTPKQKQCLDFIKAYDDEKGYAPTIEDISMALGLKGRASIIGILHRLESDGHIKRTPHKARGIEVIEADWSSVGEAASRFINSIKPSLVDEDIDDDTGAGTITLVVDAATFGDLDVAVKEAEEARP